MLHQVERALGGAVIGKVQLRIGVDDAHEGHIVEVEPLRDHLRAEQHGHRRGGELLEEALVIALVRGRVGVHADDGNVAHALE